MNKMEKDALTRVQLAKASSSISIGSIKALLISASLYTQDALESIDEIPEQNIGRFTMGENGM